jgi:hypothetical protein
VSRNDVSVCMCVAKVVSLSVLVTEFMDARYVIL